METKSAEFAGAQIHQGAFRQAGPNTKAGGSDPAFASSLRAVLGCIVTCGWAGQQDGGIALVGGKTQPAHTVGWIACTAPRGRAAMPSFLYATRGSATIMAAPSMAYGYTGRCRHGWGDNRGDKRVRNRPAGRHVTPRFPSLKSRSGAACPGVAGLPLNVFAKTTLEVLQPGNHQLDRARSASPSHGRS